MAVEVESTSQVEEFLGILRRRVLWILYPSALLFTIGVCFAIVVPKKYVCETRILVRNTLEGSTRTGANSADEARMAAHQIRSLPRIQGVLSTLGWSDYMNQTPADRQRYEKRIRSSVQVEVPSMPPGTNQQIVAISYSNTNPTRAKALLEELTARWKEEVLEQGRNAERTARDKLRAQKSMLEGERTALVAKSTDLRKAWGIPLTTEGSSTRFGAAIDPAFVDLSTREAELEELKLEILAIENRLAANRDRLNAEDVMVPVINVEEGVQNRQQIAKLNEKIFELRQEIKDRGYKPAVSHYRRINDEIRGLQEKIRFLESSETASVETDSRVPNPKRLELAEVIDDDEVELERLLARRSALEQRVREQRDMTIELQDVYAEIGSLESKIRQTDAELQDVGLRLSQKAQDYEWVSGPGGNPFDVLQDIEMPQSPSEPNPVLIAAFTLFLGLGLGLGLAALTEFGKSCFRSVADVGRVMVVPILGTINAIHTRRQLRRRRLTQLFLGGVTFGLISILGYVTWAWKANPQLLSNSVYDAIENFRSGFE